jgi:hypothetical protein
MKVFWSWQSDYLPKECRHFIKKALEEAVEKVGQELEVKDADRPSLDHDTKGEAGMVDIAATILRKISESAVFVADLTPIGKSEDGKDIPNPNVCIELGWAMQKPGVDQIIVVFNSVSGCTEKDLPFDISHRRIMSYDLPEGADKSRRASVKKQLVGELTEAIRINLKGHLKETFASTEISGVPANPKDPSIWVADKGKVIHYPAFGGENKTTVKLLEGPRSYVRVIPSGWEKGKPSVSDIQEVRDIGVNSMNNGYQNGDFGVCEKGFVRYWFSGQSENGLRETRNMSYFFDETGEFWVLHGTAINDNHLSRSFLVKGWKEAMRQSLAVFDKFEAFPKRKVVVGLFGVKDVMLFDEYQNRRTARKNDFVLERADVGWSEEAQLSFLTQAYNRALDLFALGRVDENEIKKLLNG